jgi:hypothetical protein
MEKPLLSNFQAIAPLILQSHERYLATAFDESMTLVQKVNKVIMHLDEVGSLASNVSEQWSTVMEWLLEDGMTDSIASRLDEMVLDGTLDTIINENVMNLKADTVYVDEQLGLKADQSTLETKADKVETETSINLKANKSLLSYVHVQDGGVLPTNLDNYELLQTFITANKGKVIHFGTGVYNISKPILLPMNTEIVGVSGLWNDITTGTTLKRTNNTPDLKHNVDAVLILDYEPSEGYHRNSKVLKMNLEGYGNTFRNSYGVYAPKSAFIEIKDVHIRYVDQVFYSENTWQSYISISGRYARKGIVFKSPISFATGTSIVFEKCFMSYIDEIAYDIYGLTYSTFNSCASDFIEGVCYDFNTCKGIVLNGCGAEYSADTLGNWNSTLTINSMMVLHPKGKAPSTSSAYLKTRQGGKSSFVSCDFGALENAGDTYNMICDAGATQVFINTPTPTGGNTFVSHSAGAKTIELGNAGLVVTPA